MILHILHKTTTRTIKKQQYDTYRSMQESSASEVIIVLNYRSLGLSAHFVYRVTHLPLCCGPRFQPIEWIVFGAAHENCLHLQAVEAGISKKGATRHVMFQGIMTATKYGEILTASLIPFARKAYPDGYRLYQDNDPKHTST